MTALIGRGQRSRGPYLQIPASIPEVSPYQAYIYYLKGKSVHVCIPQYTHLYTSVYTRVHDLALSISSVGLSRVPIPHS